MSEIRRIELNAADVRPEMEDEEMTQQKKISILVKGWLNV
jgi:hypothetical protein